MIPFFQRKYVFVYMYVYMCKTLYSYIPICPLPTHYTLEVIYGGFV